MALLWCNVGFAEECIGDCNNGYGTMIWEGNSYIGEFKNNIPHGKGILKLANGDFFTGDWKNGQVNGYGEVIYSNGARYVGEFKNHKFHGKGTFTEADGTIIVGKFKKNETVKIYSKDTSAKDKTDKKKELASMIDDAKRICKDLGYSEGTDKFADCSLDLYKQSVEIAANQNQQVQMQSGGTITIYDPVRDSNALIRQGQRMLSGACTLGINC